MPRRVPASVVFAVDIGSSSVRSALFREDGTRLLDTTASRAYAMRYSPDGAAVLDPAVLLRATRSCLAETLRCYGRSPFAGAPIAAVSGSGFWHGLLGLDRTGVAITPIFTWADSRSKSDAAQLRREVNERQMQLRTGCMLRAQFWPAKLRWLRRTERALFRRVIRWTSPASWAFRELFGIAATSHSMASGTGLYNLEQETWDTQLCAACAVQPEQLDVIADRHGAPTDGPRVLRVATIFTSIGDGAASNLGSGADRAGIAAINFGTSGAVRVIKDKRDLDLRNLRLGLFRYVVDTERVVSGGAISNAGNLHQWCARELRLDKGEREQALARVASASDALIVLPFWVDERAPDWPEIPGGMIAGLRQTTTAADLLRAAITSSFYRLGRILDSLMQSIEVEQIIVSGGIVRSPASVSILADAIGRDVHICREPESSLRGAAVHALNQLGREIKALPAGRVIRHRPDLAKEHLRRRREQEALERRMLEV